MSRPDLSSHEESQDNENPSNENDLDIPLSDLLNIE